MDRTCTLCNFTSRSGYHFDSHLASDSHRRAKLEADNKALIEALEYILIYADKEIKEFGMTSTNHLIAEAARDALERAKG